VDVRVRPVAEVIPGLERGRHVRRVSVPVGDADGAQDDIPALTGVSELAPQPVRRHDAVRVGGRQPDRGRASIRGQPQQFGHPGRPRRAHVASADPGHPGAAGPGGRDGLVRAGIGHHQQVHRHAHSASGAPQRPQAGGQQPLLVVGRHHHADGLDHARPVACATETGTLSVRM